MKKALLLLASVAAAIAANAQPAAGSTASDFTFTDIDGTPHRLYDYLDAGKTVFLDVSTAWCAPCWNYHRTHELRKLYATHGPAGYPDVDAATTDDVMVLFIEAELTNTGAQITGTSSGGDHDAYTMGDWTEGTTYPIIDLPSDAGGQAFIDDYAIQHYPTIIKICPNRQAMAVERWSSEVLYRSTQSCTALEQPVDVVALMYTGTDRDCNGHYVPLVKIQNNGSQPLSDVTVTVMDGNTVLSTGTLIGTLNTYETTDVTCSPITGFAGGTVEILATSASDVNAANGTLEKELFVPPFVPLWITVHVRTDNFPQQTTWEIRNSADQVVADGGPYSGINGSGGGPDALATKFHELQLPAGADCYSVHLFDWWGNGMQAGENPAGPCGLEIFAQGESKFALLDFFTTEAIGEAAFYTDATSGLTDAAVPAFSVYPNPASGEVSVALTADHPEYTVALTDLQGRVLQEVTHSGASGEQVVTMPVDAVAPGNYLVRVTVNGVSSVKKIVVDR